jgi:hypothetical protein
MSLTRVRSRRKRRVWRTLVPAGVSLGLAAGCLLNKVEFDGPEARAASGLSRTDGGVADAAMGSSDAGGSPQENMCATPGSAECSPLGPLQGAVGSACGGDESCLSRHCAEGRCVAATCTDQITNQGESDQDCGGICPLRCAEDQACLVDLDCEPNLFCPPATRRCTASCTDRMRNGAEILTDCGGGVCPGCPDATECTEAADCDSGVCSNAGCTEGVASCCQPASCDDDVLNGEETDRDCGGDLCPPCSDGAQCLQARDCANASCSFVCISCGDGAQNGLETGIDCGGSDSACRRCNPTEPCLVNSDCMTGLCSDGVC